ncbi:MAG: ABC transporter substrate-binding protein [Acidovorax sp.]|jgi:ABC-type branched-subunit amino acid transport system substrate-binding protein|uniref:ABC transporter substrate-binding protein n=1 Tax=Acidovorax sp. TaxID=1872122 RepID=UPI000B0894B3|nr:ABC transporter substrate-binding protein [Acidovorax sp.]MDH4448238.1 ABC transporter substrate-binding protein [Acidovorax sp.]MDH4465079.1 ABC transporter substrate-binding protein [Acidovorax sp.]
MTHAFATHPVRTNPDGRRRRILLALAGTAALGSGPALAQQVPARGDILIGRSTAMSGGMAPFLAPIHEGQDAAIEDFNARGGVGGRKIRLVTMDDGFDARRTLENARQMTEKDGVLALFGVSGTTQVMTLLPYLAQARVPLISVYTGSPAVRAQQHPYLFTTRANYADELVKIVRNLVAVQTSRIAVAYENNDFGKLLLPLVEKTIAAENATLAGSHALASSGEDAAAAAKALSAQKPQAVLLVAAGPSVVAYVRANREHLGVPVYTLSLGAGTAVLKALGDDARGLAVARTGPSPSRPNIQLTRDFQASMKRHDKPVDYDRYTGYMDARVLIEGLRAAGPNVTRASLVQAMEGLGTLDLGGYVYQFSAQNHHGSNYVDIAVVGAGGVYRQ